MRLGSDGGESTDSRRGCSCKSRWRTAGLSKYSIWMVGSTQDGTGRWPPSQSCKTLGEMPKMAENSPLVSPAFSIWLRRTPGGSGVESSVGDMLPGSADDRVRSASEGDAADADSPVALRAATAVSSDASSSSSVNGVRSFLLQSIGANKSPEKEESSFALSCPSSYYCSAPHFSLRVGVPAGVLDNSDA